MNSEKRSKNLRAGRKSLHNQVYHITLACKDRAKVFQNFNYARHFIQQIKQADENHYSYTLAFVVMPDHIHWLVQIKDMPLQQLVQRIKSFTSKAIGQKIWQRGFHDHAIRSDEDLINVARYIVANPLRANLVKTVSDYPHWDSIWL